MHLIPWILPCLPLATLRRLLASDSVRAWESHGITDHNYCHVQISYQRAQNTRIPLQTNRTSFVSQVVMRNRFPNTTQSTAKAMARAGATHIKSYRKLRFRL